MTVGDVFRERRLASVLVVVLVLVALGIVAVLVRSGGSAPEASPGSTTPTGTSKFAQPGQSYVSTPAPTPNHSSPVLPQAKPSKVVLTAATGDCLLALDSAREVFNLIPSGLALVKYPGWVDVLNYRVSEVRARCDKGTVDVWVTQELLPWNNYKIPNTLPKVGPAPAK